MSVPWVIIGLGAVGGLWVAKAGPFKESAPQPILAHEPSAGSTESSPQAADGYAQPEVVHEQTNAVDVVAETPAEPTVHQVSTNLQSAANTVQVATDSLGMQPSITNNLTDGTKSGGTQRPDEAPSPNELAAQVSVESTVFSDTYGMTTRDINRATREHGTLLGQLW